MTRILVFSDTHGRTAELLNAVAEHSEASYLIHLGDCERDIEEISYINDQIKVLSCPGNCDYFSRNQSYCEVRIAGKKIFFTHGHLHMAKMGNERLLEEGKKRGADIVLYGHTHLAENEYVEGLYIFNPGSISRPQSGGKSYGIIDIMEEKSKLNVFLKIVRV